MYAFWEYDKFPYVLGGEIIEVKDKGQVVVKGYISCLFTPIAILPLEVGEKIAEKMKVLESRYSDEKEKLLSYYTKKTHEILPNRMYS